MNSFTNWLYRRFSLYLPDGESQQVAVGLILKLVHCSVLDQWDLMLRQLALWVTTELEKKDLDQQDHVLTMF